MNSCTPKEDSPSAERPHQRTVRVAYLTNIVAPYWKPALESLARRYQLRVFLSTRMESNRPWQVDWGDLDVVLQRSVTLRRRWKHPGGFAEPVYVHLPIDTVSQLRHFRAEVVLSNEMGFRTLLACVYRTLTPHSRLIVGAEIAESTERGRGHSRAILRRLLRNRVDAFLVLGQSGARYIHSLGVPQSKIFAIGFTTDVQKFCCVPLARPAARAHRLLYVGQLIDRKGLLPFLTSLSEWASRHPQYTLEFVIVGDGPTRAKLENACLPPNLQMSFRGNVAFSDLAEIYAQCGIFAFPTLADTWGVVVNEAMAAGLPVLGSIYSQAVEELVEDGQNGWPFHPDNESDTYSTIDRALNTSVDVLNDMRKYARNKALQYTPDIVGANIGKAIQRVWGER